MNLLTLPYVLALLLMIIGLYAVVAKKNLIKVVVGLLIIEHAVNLFLLLMGYRWGGVAPIRTAGDSAETFAARAVDPLPQAMILTSIVIGLGILALVVALVIRLYEKYGTFDVTQIRQLRG